MKHITITYLAALRLTMMLKAVSGTRKDLKLRIARGIRKRLDIDDPKLDTFARPVGGDRVILDLRAIAAQPDQSLDIAVEEARLLMEMLDALPATIDDLESWIDPLALVLEGACVEA